MKYWVVDVLLDGNPMPLTLCRVLSIDALASIVKALAASEETRPISVRTVHEPDPEPPAPPF